MQPINAISVDHLRVFDVRVRRIGMSKSALRGSSNSAEPSETIDVRSPSL